MSTAAVAAAMTPRVALRPDRFAYVCHRHPAPVFGADRETVAEAARDWSEHDVRSHRP